VEIFEKFMSNYEYRPEGQHPKPPLPPARFLVYMGNEPLGWGVMFPNGKTYYGMNSYLRFADLLNTLPKHSIFFCDYVQVGWIGDEIPPNVTLARVGQEELFNIP